MMKSEDGFTLVETGLAMAASTLATLLTLGLTLMVRRNIFTTNIRESQTFLQTQYNEVRSGINSRSGSISNANSVCSDLGETGGGSSNQCYAIGRLVEITNDDSKGGVIRSVQLLAWYDNGGSAAVESPWPDEKASGWSNIKNSNLHLYAVYGEDNGAIARTEKYLNGNTVDATYSNYSIDNDNFSEGNRMFLIIKSPVDASNIIAVTDKTTSQLTDVGGGMLEIDKNSLRRLEKDQITGFLIGDSRGALGSKGLLCIGAGSNGATVSSSDSVGDINAGNLQQECSNMESR